MFPLFQYIHIVWSPCYYAQQLHDDSLCSHHVSDAQIVVRQSCFSCSWCFSRWQYIAYQGVAWLFWVCRCSPSVFVDSAVYRSVVLCASFDVTTVVCSRGYCLFACGIPLCSTAVNYAPPLAALHIDPRCAVVFHCCVSIAVCQWLVPRTTLLPWFTVQNDPNSAHDPRLSGFLTTCFVLHHSPHTEKTYACRQGIEFSGPWLAH